MKQGVNGFQSTRLREAREARGLKCSDLAELAGLSRQSISAYENGLTLPQKEILSRLSKILNIPEQFLLDSTECNDIGDVFFRSFASATKTLRLRAGRKCGWVSRILDYLSGYIDFLPLTLPEIEIGGLSNNIPPEDIEKIALECRKKWGLGDGPISDVVRLLENNGIIVSRIELETRKLDAFSTRDPNTNIPIIILGSDKDCSVRSRLDAGHELGHIILHKSVKPDQENLKIIEKQAFKFGAAFLLPSESFASDIGTPSLDTFWALKSKWKVSIAAMIMRCRDLDIINDKRKERLFINYSRKGWKRGEPLDDELQTEEPMFLKRCFKLLVNEKIRNREDFAGDLSLSNYDIETITGLPEGYLDNTGSKIQILPSLKNTTKTTKPTTSSTKGKVVKFPIKK